MTEEKVKIKTNPKDKTAVEMTIDEAKEKQSKERISLYVETGNGTWTHLDKVYPDDVW